MNLLLSVIIPAYNVEKYIEECVRACENQDIDRGDYEVIVVDDASTDSTGAVLARLAAEFDNLKVITNTENRRMGPSRNQALSVASGKYIIYSDSDDFWQPNVFKGLVERMESDNLQMLHFAFNNVNDSGKYLSTVRSSYPEDVVMCGDEMIVAEKFLAYVWSYVWRRDFVMECGIDMPSIAFEDIEYTLKMLTMASRTAYTSEPKYNYRRRPQSILRCYNPQRHLDMVEAFRSIRDFLISGDNPLGWQVVRPVAQFCLFREFRYVIKKRVGVERQILEAMRQMNLLPVPNPFNTFRAKLFNSNPDLFIVYYKILHFPTRTKQLISRKPIM